VADSICARCRGDIREIYGRCRGDIGEIYGRWQADARGRLDLSGEVRVEGVRVRVRVRV